MMPNHLFGLFGSWTRALWVDKSVVDGDVGFSEKTRRMVSGKPDNFENKGDGKAKSISNPEDEHV